MIHVPGHTSDECTVLKVSLDKYAVQRPHKIQKPAKRGRSVDICNNTQEVNMMVTYYNPIPKKKSLKTDLKLQA